MPRVLWRLSSWNPDIASVRYRAAIPALHLEARGVRSVVSVSPERPLRRLKPDLIVFAKAFGDDDVALSAEAAAQRIPVVLDVCDNIFAPGYVAHSAANLRLMAATASALVTTGLALKQVLASELGADRRIEIIPDPVETPDDARRAARLIEREEVRRVPFSPLAIGRIATRRARASFVGHPPRRANDGLPQAIWFGNVGTEIPRFGIINVVDVAPALAEACRETPFRLLVVTGDRGAYLRYVASLPLATSFARWSRLGIFQHLRASAVAVLPNSLDAFSVCKSANRAALALSQGVPVVATRIPSLEVFDGCVLFDDIRAGVVAYLRDRDLASEHVLRAKAIIERELSASAVASRWWALIRSIVRDHAT